MSHGLEVRCSSWEVFIMSYEVDGGKMGQQGREESRLGDKEMLLIGLLFLAQNTCRFECRFSTKKYLTPRCFWTRSSKCARSVKRYANMESCMRSFISCSSCTTRA
jgi:hypothetical protein